jgi:hypothetical protein
LRRKEPGENTIKKSGKRMQKSVLVSILIKETLCAALLVITVTMTTARFYTGRINKE